MLSDLLAFSPEEQLPGIFHAVWANGCSEWYELGLELGFKHDKILKYCQSIPEHSSKLLAFLEIKAKAVSLGIVEDLVVNACHQVPRPIHWVVEH
jgi:hypothetical protein